MDDPRRVNKFVPRGKLAAFFYTAARSKLLVACHTSPKRMLKRWSGVSVELSTNNSLSVLLSSHLP